MNSADYRLLVGFPNRIDAASLSGGAWVESLPLANLQDRALARVARSIDLDLSSTNLTIDLGRQRSIRILALIAHNLSFSGRIRIRASDNPGFATTVYDQTADAWPAAGGDWNIAELEWETDNYWLGSYSQDETEGQTPIAASILAAPIQARYWRLDIIDLQNTAGFVDIGRVFIGDGFLTPTINYSYGATLGYEDATGVETALSGAEFFDPREPLRVMRFQLANMTDAEGFTQALELTRRAGIWREVFVVADPSDLTFGAVRNFMGRLRTLSALEQAAFQLNTMSFEIKELR
jgi:hypothetical protein